MPIVASMVSLLVPLVIGPGDPVVPAVPTDHGPRPCPEMCTMQYQPVKCVLDGGRTMTFGNRCAADAYACLHRMRILRCGENTH